MKVKLMQGISGDGCGRAGFFMPRQIIKCSDRQGARWISEGIAVAAPDSAETDGEFFDQVPEAAPAKKDSKKQPETPEGRRTKPETPEGAKGQATCQGKTKAGNACMKKPLPGSRYCSKEHEKAA